ncbi:MAG: hypothetical protein O2950_07330 [Proteobacteria bacterium]|mgnify:FL=1|nr:hypothetical protein [Pseudomonadota bacterium]MDA1352085.1 hypothetical protein [Pseudomonadota bacterium]
MAIKLRNGVLDIEKIQIDNPIVAEYLAGLPDSQREQAIVKAIGIGVLAGIKGEIAQFLHETEGELGKRLVSLKALYELRELRFKETSRKGEKAEQQVMQALAEIQTAAKYDNDEILDLSMQRGQLPRNKTGDVMVAIDGKHDCAIGFEVKLDKGVKLGMFDNRDPAAQTDTAIGQLLEMRANRNTLANVIIFDEDSVDPNVWAECVGGVKFIQGVGFIVIISTRRGDFSNLAVVYAICREMAIAHVHTKKIDGPVMTMIVERLLYLLSDYKSVEKEVSNIQKSADKIKVSLDKVSQYIASTEQYLQHYLDNGELSKEQLFSFYTAKQLEIDPKPTV